MRQMRRRFVVCSAVPVGLVAVRKHPGVETPGYFHVVPAGTSGGGRVALSAIRNSQFEMVRAFFPVFILGWTMGAIDG